MRSLSRRLRSTAYDGLRLVLGVPWITGRLGGTIDDGRRQTRLGAFFDRRPKLLVTEVYGLYALGMLAWFSWSRPEAVRPPITARHAVDVYVCTYDEPVE